MIDCQYAGRLCVELCQSEDINTFFSFLPSEVDDGIGHTVERYSYVLGTINVPFRLELLPRHAAPSLSLLLSLYFVSGEIVTDGDSHHHRPGGA